MNNLDVAGATRCALRGQRSAMSLFRYVRREFALGGVLLFARVFAADAADLIRFPQGDYACTVEVTPHTVPRPDPSHPEVRYAPVLKRIGITKVGQFRRDVSVFSDNSISQLWDLPEKKVAALESNTGRKDIYLLVGFLREHARSPLLSFDLKSLSWITDKSMVKEDSGATLHYRASIVVSQPGEAGAAAVYHAWIDPKTLLPVKLDDGEATYALTFVPAPAGPLVVPPNIKAQFDAYDAAYAVRPR